MEPILVQIREQPLLLEGLQNALQRLHPKHEAIRLLDAKIFSLEAGISGEGKLAKIFRKHSFSFTHRIFHGLSLESASLFQMDFLFLTPFYAVIFEVKNISGRITFVDAPPQLIRTRETGEVDGFESPAAQVERNGELFHIWLQSHGIQIPLYRIVVLAYPKQIVEKAPAKIKVLFPSLVPSFLRRLPREKPILDEKTFNWLTNKLLSSHKTYVPRPICEMYEIPKDDIRTGVICSECGSFGMIKIKRSWRCSKCGHLDNKAHERAVRDWFLLIGREMTNKDCREFLHVDQKTASRILNGMNLKTHGSFRYRKYSMNFIDNQKR